MSESSAVSVKDGMVVSDDAELDMNEIRRIDFGKEIKPSSSGARISLVGGGTIGASTLKLDGETFVLENVAGTVSLGVDAVTKIQFKNESLPLYAKAETKEDLDQLFVKIEGTYQTVPGIVDSLDSEKVTFLYDEKAIEFKTEDVFGLILARAAGSEEVESNGVVSLTEGSKLNCVIKSVTADQVQATIGEIADITLPISVVSVIEIRSNRLAFLSDLKPDSIKSQEGAVFARQLQNDRNISGGKLVLRDRVKRLSRTFQKGLGTKSGMSIAYTNTGFDRFVALIGIDASTNGNGVCQVRVLGDGKELYSAELTGVDPPRPLDLEIAGVKEVELVVEFGKDFLDLSDHVNWCDARFVKNSK